MRHLVGRRVSEGSDFCIYVFVTILSKPILYVQWLASSPFWEAVILYNLIFQKIAPIFFVFCLACSLKNETLSNSINVILVPCLVE